MQLPSCLTQETDGTIHVSEHRICLEHLIELARNGASQEELRNEFPTLSASLVDEVLAFYAANRSDVDAYVAKRRMESDQLYEATPKRFPLDQLRTRFVEIQKAKTV
jgi:uncharacterized protein (DUF433 family)